MEFANILLELLLILISARVLGHLARVMGAPAVIGELFAGIVIGPSLLGWVDISENIYLLGEIGVILLLFSVGLETDVGRLAASGGKSFVVAVGGFFAPLLLGFSLSHYVFELPVITSLFIGGTLTATSIGITIRTLSDINQHLSKEGQITLGAAVLDDVFGVILLAILYDFSITGTMDWLSMLKVFAFVGLFFLVAPLLARMFSWVIQFLDKRIDDPGLIPSTIVALVLFVAWLAHLFGAPELLGGFAAGLALSRRFFLPFGRHMRTSPRFSDKIETGIRPIVHLFAPIFFVSVGLSLDLRSVDWSSPFFWSLSLGLALVAIATKFTGAMLIKEPILRRVIVGMSMVPRGEVGLIFAGLGASASIFTDEVYTAVIMVITYTTLLSPFWIKLFYKHYGGHLKNNGGASAEPVPAYRQDAE